MTEPPEPNARSGGVAVFGWVLRGYRLRVGGSTAYGCRVQSAPLQLSSRYCPVEAETTAGPSFRELFRMSLVTPMRSPTPLGVDGRTAP